MDGSRLADPIVVEGARVLLPDGEARVSVRIEGSTITGLDCARDGARVVDARGLVLAPAMVDIHGDAFERQLMPRPGVFFPLDAALLETDRQLACNGIATAYHALTLSWEPGLRSVELGTRVFERLQALTPRLTVENRLQLRWETFCFEAEPLIARALAAEPLPAVAFNDHTTMAVLHPDVPLQARPFDHAPDFPVADLQSPEFAQKMKARAARSDLPVETYVALLAETWARRPEVVAAIDRVAAAGRAANAPMLSHDDSRPETRRFYRDRSARIAEFPMNRETARAARDNGDWIVFGAPNAARGGSHLGSPGAAGMLAEGLCDILASDYFYPAMLAAVARLYADGAAPFHRLWDLVARNPARALGLGDRGEIAPGRRADLVLIDWPESGVPAPVLTMSAGRPAYATRGLSD